MRKILRTLSGFSLMTLITGTFSVLALAIAMVGWLAISALDESEANLKDIYVSHVVPTGNLTGLVGPVRDVGYRMVAFLAGQLPAAGCHSKLGDSASELATRWQSFKAQVDGQKADAELIASVEHGVSQFAQFKDRLAAAYKGGNSEVVGKLFEDEWPTIQADLLSPIQKLVAAKEVAVKLSYDSVVAKSHLARIKTISVVAVAALCLLVALLILRKMAGSMNRFGIGVEHLHSESMSLRKISQSFLSASQALAQASVEQTAAFDQTSTAMSEMDATIQTNLSTMNRSIGVATKCESSTKIGLESVGRMLTSIETISAGNDKILRQVDHGNSQINEIIRVIEAIGNKTKVINDIVFQTKLLSFNASVEAARAGEHGKGFAVVAEEVGNLARMSGLAAGEISEMLDGSTRRVREIVEMMGGQIGALVVESNSGIEEGKRVAIECDASLKLISASVDDMSRTISTITDSAKEQARTISEAANAVVEASNITRLNSENAGKISHDAELLTEKSEAMGELVSGLNGLVNGENSAAA